MKFKRIYIEITNSCNLNCSFCSKSFRDKRNMSILEFENVLKKIEKYNDFIYLQVKGEHLLNPNTIISLRFWTLEENKMDDKTKKYISILKRYFNINEINNNTKLIDNVYVSLQNIFEWPSNANSNSDGYCLGGNSHIGILSDGSVVICCLDGEGESNLGNIFYEDLSFILNSEKYHNIINYFKNNKCYLDICKKCTYKNRFK